MILYLPFFFSFFSFFFYTGGVDDGNHSLNVKTMVSYDAVAIYMVTRASLCEVTDASVSSWPPRICIILMYYYQFEYVETKMKICTYSE